MSITAKAVEKLAEDFAKERDEKGPVTITSDRDIVDQDHMSAQSLKEALQQLVKYAASLEAEKLKEDGEVSTKNGD